MNKGIVIVIGMVLLATTSLAGLQPPVFESDVDSAAIYATKECDLAFAAPDVVDKDSYVSVHVEGATASLQWSEAPQLPYVTRTFSFPIGTTLRDVTVTHGPAQSMALDRKVTPAPTPVPLSMQPMEVTVTEGPVYATDELYPASWATWHTGVGIENGEHVLFVTARVFPARYNPVQDTIQFINDIHVEIAYDLPETPLLAADAYDMVIIAPEKFTGNLQDLVTHKESMGVATKMVTLDEVYGGTYFTAEGRDDAEKVKYFIKNALEQWGIEYVLLVGGRHGGFPEPKWWCPTRLSYLDVSDGDRYFLSDLYFADIYKYENNETVFDDWDSNGNGVHGEWAFTGKDIVDMYPDLSVGRLACRNAFEVKIMVEKIISYETGAYGQDWTNRYVGIGGDTFPGDQWYDGEEGVLKTIEYLAPLGIEDTTLFTSDGTLSEGQDIIDAVSAGCGFLNFEGHGNPMSWANHPPQDGETWIGIDESQFIFFKNKDMYPVCVIGGCSNSKFDISLLNLLDFENLEEHYMHSSWGPESFGWWIVRKIDGGAIASIGCTSYGYGSSGDSDHDGIFDGIQYRGGFIDIEFFRQYAQEGKETVGAAHAGAITEYLNKFPPMTDRIDGKTVEEWVLLGDPSLKIGGYS